MTWDVYAIKPPAGVRRLEDLPAGFEPPPIGAPAEVVETIRRIAPHLNATDPMWLKLDAPDHSIEVSLGKGLNVREVVFFIHEGDGAVGVVLDVCRELGVAPYDTEAGGILTASSSRPVPPPLDADEQAAGGKRSWWRRLRKSD